MLPVLRVGPAINPGYVLQPLLHFVIEALQRSGGGKVGV
jgi:hypothetical protein